MSGRDDRAADWLADREPIECPECGGTGMAYADPEVDGRYGPILKRCIHCAGRGYWLGAI